MARNRIHFKVNSFVLLIFQFAHSLSYMHIIVRCYATNENALSNKCFNISLLCNNGIALL